MKKITPFLWFNTEAEEAARFYTSIFPGSKIGTIVRYGKSAPGPEGSVMTIAFEIMGTEFLALNGGPVFQFNESISFVIPCDNQEEIDHYWSRLTEGGQESQCGWLKDKYGLSWQVVPKNMGTFLSNDDPERANRVMKEMMTMKKMDLAALEKAYEEVVA